MDVPKQLQLYAVDFPEGKGFLQEDLVYSIEGSPSGTAFRTMKPLTLQSPFTGWLHYPIVQIAVREGLKSFCFFTLDQPESRDWHPVFRPIPRRCVQSGGYRFP